jgi:hypothetical protein
MGMFDTIKCEYPLPDAEDGGEFQTKSFGDGFVGGFMDDYTITKEGRLIYHKTTYETVPEEERPYFGTPEWEKNPLLQVCGCMRPVHIEDIDMEYHGYVNMYTCAPGSGTTWWEYDIKFTDGVICDVKRVYEERGLGNG